MTVGTQDLRFRVLASVIGSQAIDKLRNSVKGVSTSTEQLSSKFPALENGLRNLAAAVTAGALVQFGRNIIDTGDELFNLSQKTGIAVRELSGLQAAAAKADVPIEALEGSLRKFSVNLVQARQGNNDLATAFKALGVSITSTNGQLAPSGEIIKRIADRFSQLEDGPQKAALAVRLFGRSGTDLIPVLNEGADAISRLGLAIDDDFAARADAFNDSLTESGIAIKNLFITGLAEALPAFQETINSFSGSGQGIDAVKAIFIGLGEAVRLTAQIIDGFATSFIIGIDAIQSAVRTGLGFVIGIFQRVGTDIVSVGSQLRALFKGDFAEITRIQEETGRRIAAIDKKSQDERLALYDGFTKRFDERQRAFADRTNRRLENSVVVGALAGKKLEDVLASQRNSTRPTARRRGLPQADVGPSQESIRKQQKEIEQINEYKARQSEALELRKLELESITLSSTERQKLLEAKRIELEADRASKDFSEENRQKYLEAAQAIKEQRLALIDFEEQQKATYSVGAQQALNDYLDKAKDVAAQTRNLFNNAFQNIEDSIVDFVKTGQINFKKFADDIITDLIRIQVRALLVQAITGIATFATGGGTATAGTPAITVGNTAANGGVMTQFGMTPLKKYAAGGIANSPQLAVFGEGATPEAYVPLPDGRTIPVTLEGKGSGSGGVNVNVVVNVESNQTSAESEDQNGRQLGFLISTAVKNELINQKRPGGLLA